MAHDDHGGDCVRRLGPAVTRSTQDTNRNGSELRQRAARVGHTTALCRTGTAQRPDDPDAAPYAIDDFAADALQLLDALGVRRATVVGHSMGSFVARAVAARAPNRVERLVLIGTARTARNAATEELRRAVAKLADPVDPQFARSFQAGSVSRPVPEAFMARIVAGSAQLPAWIWKDVLAQIIAYRAPDGKISCPTLVIGGDQDGLFSVSEQEAVACAIRGAQVVMLPGVGHSPNWEEPERVAQELAGFRSQ